MGFSKNNIQKDCKNQQNLKNKLKLFLFIYPNFNKAFLAYCMRNNTFDKKYNLSNNRNSDITNFLFNFYFLNTSSENLLLALAPYAKSKFKLLFLLKYISKLYICYNLYNTKLYKQFKK